MQDNGTNSKPDTPPENGGAKKPAADQVHASATGWPGMDEFPSPHAERVAPWSVQHFESQPVGWVDKPETQQPSADAASANGNVPRSPREEPADSPPAIPGQHDQPISPQTAGPFPPSRPATPEFTGPQYVEDYDDERTQFAPTQQPTPTAPPSQPPTPDYPSARQPYAAEPYSAQPYSGQPYSAHPYPAPPHAAQPHSAQPYSGQQPYSARPYSAQPYSGQQQYAPPSSAPQPAQPMAPPPTAEEFAARRAHKPVAPEATMGVPALVRKMSFGMVAPAPSRRERDFRDAVTKVRRNFGGLRQITVVNPKGGAGKTVAVLMTAMTFGQSRGGYVLAWDNNETQGTLGMRAQQDFHTRTVRDVLHDLDVFMGIHGRVGDLSSYVRAQGEAMFDVLASDESATAGEMLTARAFADIREVVSRFYKLIIVDTGNNVRAENWQAAIDATDQLVVTMSARGDSAETAARMLDHLEQTGRDQLVRQAVTVVSMPASRKGVDLPAIQRHFAARTRQVLIAPYERLLDSGEPIRYGELSQDSRDSWLKIAASIAEGL